MLDLEQPEAKKIIKACYLIEALSKSFTIILSLDGEEKEKLFGKNRVLLGKLGLLADDILDSDKKELANKHIMLLYKALTGEISATEQDADKVARLLNGLSDDCFHCWCI